MTTDEAKAAFRRGDPVVFGGVRYKEISAFITRKDKTSRRFVTSLELLDVSGRAVVIAPPDKVEPTTEGK